jgi:Lrp/AsnC family leucine-responsive transcriptional regulator
MDAVDWRILAELQDDARLSQNEISRRVSLSAPAVAERIRRLVDQGVIDGYAARINPAALGRAVQAFVQLDCYGAVASLRTRPCSNGQKSSNRIGSLATRAAYCG